MLQEPPGGDRLMLVVDVKNLSHRNGALPSDGGAGVPLTALAAMTGTCLAGGEKVLNRPGV